MCPRCSSLGSAVSCLNFEFLPDISPDRLQLPSPVCVSGCDAAFNLSCCIEAKKSRLLGLAEMVAFPEDSAASAFSWLQLFFSRLQAGADLDLDDLAGTAAASVTALDSEEVDLVLQHHQQQHSSSFRTASAVKPQ